MSMELLWNRYVTKSVAVTAESRWISLQIIGDDQFQEEIRKRCKKNPSKFSGDKHVTFFIRPFHWNGQKEIKGFVIPMGIPLVESRKTTFDQAKKMFIKEWSELATDSFYKCKTWKIVIGDAIEDKTIQSYIEWQQLPKNKKKKLAFIYMGIFWLYQDESESLDEAAKRFIKKMNLQKPFKEEANKKCWTKNTTNQYSQAILNDGALMFDHSGYAIAKIHNCFDPAVSVWKRLCIMGYFSWVKELRLISSHHYTEYLE